MNSPPRVASAVLLCALAWLSLNVWGNYRGHLSGLFYTGAKVALPPALDGDATFRVRDDAGYDAQFYRLAAHDPLLRKGYAAFVDNPPLRWRRIGIPGLAALLSFGSEAAIDPLYIALQLAFVFAGAWWLARFAESAGASPAWGFAFLLIPATAISLDRMTIDLPLTALVIALALYSAGSSSEWPRRLVLAAAPLVRETGMVVTAAWSLRAAARREWRESFVPAACGLPALLWWLYVRAHTAPDGTAWSASYPFSGIVSAILEPAPATPTPWLRAAAALEWFALAGVVLALCFTFGFAMKRRFGALETGAVVFALFAATLGRADIWDSAYAFGRTMSPLLTLLGLIALRDRKPYLALPVLLILPRIALQYEAQLAGALRR